jgi:hypothetical protein
MALQFIVDSSGNVVLAGSVGGRNKYTILPHHDANLTILNFQTRVDLVDFSQFPGINDLSGLSYSTEPLILLLPDHQRIILSSHPTFDLTESNFLFSSASSNNDGAGGSSGDSSESIVGSFFTKGAIVTGSIFVGLLVGMMVFCRGNREGRVRKSNKLDQSKERIMPSLPTHNASTTPARLIPHRPSRSRPFPPRGLPPLFLDKHDEESDEEEEEEEDHLKARDDLSEGDWHLSTDSDELSDWGVVLSGGVNSPSGVSWYGGDQPMDDLEEQSRALTDFDGDSDGFPLNSSHYSLPEEPEPDDAILFLP